MFIHIGNQRMIRSREIVMILDYRKIIKSAQSGAFLAGVSQDEKENIPNISLKKDQKKISTIIVTKEKCYFSSISPGTIERRIKGQLYE